MFTTPGFHLREKVSECGLKKVLMPGGAIIHPSNQFATVNTWHSKILHEDNFTNNLSLSKPWDIQCEPCCKGCIEHDCMCIYKPRPTTSEVSRRDTCNSPALHVLLLRTNTYPRGYCMHVVIPCILSILPWPKGCWLHLTFINLLTSDMHPVQLDRGY